MDLQKILVELKLIYLETVIIMIQVFGSIIVLAVMCSVGTSYRSSSLPQRFAFLLTKSKTTSHWFFNMYSKRKHRNFRGSEKGVVLWRLVFLLCVKCRVSEKKTNTVLYLPNK